MKRLVLIDGHALLFRAFHAYPPLTTGKGELVNAVYGFTNMLLGAIRELKPTHIVMTFDRAAPTFRHAAYTQYKATRAEMPSDLAGQQDRVEEMVAALNIPIFAMEGYEADDVIGTLARQAESQQLDQVVIVTGDHDALQLVDRELVRVYMPGRGKIPAKLYDETGVAEKYGGLTPEQIPEYKGLVGDASDNIPGVRGIGPKMAIKLLTEFGTVEGVYKNLDQVKDKFGDRVLQQLAEGQEQAVLSKELATIDRQVPIELKLPDCEVHEYDKDRAMKLLEELGFGSLVKKLPNDSFEEMVQEAMF